MGKAERATGFIVLGNQLFPLRHLEPHRAARIFMAEDLGLCTYVRHHKQKLTLFLAAMRSYRDALREAGFEVHYVELGEPGSAGDESFEQKLREFVERNAIESLSTWEVEDKFFEHRLQTFAGREHLSLRFESSPMFLTPRETLDAWFAEHRPHMADFYRFQRTRLHVLVSKHGKPRGGKWSYDSENRKRLPARVRLPGVAAAAPTAHVRDLLPLVAERFAEHPGELTLEGWWLPTTRAQALDGVDGFLSERFARFGPYEDALSTRDPFLFHSVLTPALNLGLITPEEVLERALEHAEEHRVPLASLEGFVRQVIGWREFVRGVYRRFSREQENANFFKHRRSLTDHWYRGSTGLPPLDDVIAKAQRWGWTHHIERLMVVGNLMTLCEIEPLQAHTWFMELYVDSSDWVMGPNVYGMGLFSDGGVFATKPYICGSNYLLKMSDYAKPRAGEAAPTWADTIDGLYWRFIDKHRDFFAGQARLAYAVGTFDRMDASRRARLLEAAEQFLERVTTARPPSERLAAAGHS